MVQQLSTSQTLRNELPVKKLSLLFYLMFGSLILAAFFTSCSGSDNPVEAESPMTILKHFGQLHIDGTQLVSQSGDPVILRGMSLFWSQWIPKYYNQNCIQWLRDDWKCTIIRAAMAVDYGGYLENPQTEMTKVFQVIDACINLGIYVLVDWHDHEAENHVEQAKTFFRSVANKYGNKPNIIYEIYNEPLQVSWSDVIKPYAQEVISEIRNIDPDNVIIVGTPNWSQDVEDAANDPLEFDNIAYALHFYTGTHRQWLRNKAMDAMNQGLALFVTEWGLSEASGAGDIDYTETKYWMDFVDQHNLSCCNWSVADKDETSAALKPGADENGNWENLDLTESGLYVRNAIRTYNSPLFDSLQPSP
jgi:endoglucanase